MKEKEYIQVMNVTSITIAVVALNNILGDDIVKKEDLQKMKARLLDWQEKIYKEINADENTAQP